MSIIIQYPKQFSKENKDFIIVLSKLSELRNIDNLPISSKCFSQSKELQKTLSDSHYSELFLESSKSGIFHYIRIIT